MKRIMTSVVILLAATGTLLAAQIYRWVDEQGNVEWRDTPPPPNAKKVEIRRPGGSMIETSSLPYSVQQAAKNFPVTLWTTDCGAPCDQARAHLARRGVPYTEKDPQNDIEAFTKLTGGSEVPVLYVGANRVKGYLESEWDAALDVAGYPRTAITAGGKPLMTRAPAAKAAPARTPSVRLYTHPDCGASCDEARSLLAERGVGFQEVLVREQAAIDELHKISGDTRVPVLVIGESVTRGFHAPSYHDALDSAGFQRGRQSARP